MAKIGEKLYAIRENKRWLLPLSFGIYTGWLFIASVVNIAAALVKLEWSGFGLADNIWATITLIVAILLVVAVLSKLRNAVFTLPVAWAYWGIYQFLKAPEGFKGEFSLLQNTAIAGMVVLVVVAAVQFYRNDFSLLPSSSK